jgi:CRP-like cAMP-binding protein
LNDKNILKILNETILFKNVNEINLLDIYNKMILKLEEFKKNEIIALESQNCTSIGIIVAGNIQVQKIYPSGKTLAIDTLYKGDIFGEVIIFSSQHLYPATITALSKTKILFIKKDSLKKIFNENEIVLENFMMLLSEKILMLNKKVKIISYKSIREKIAEIILDLKIKQNSNTIILPYNRNEMADLIGIPRPSLSRELSNLKGEDIIDYYKNTIKILDITAFKKILENTN